MYLFNTTDSCLRPQQEILTTEKSKVQIEKKLENCRHGPDAHQLQMLQDNKVKKSYMKICIRDIFGIKVNKGICEYMPGQLLNVLYTCGQWRKLQRVGIKRWYLTQMERSFKE